MHYPLEKKSTIQRDTEPSNSQPALLPAAASSASIRRSKHEKRTAPSHAFIESEKHRSVKQELKNAWDNAPVAMMILDAEHRIVTANKQCKDVLSLPVSICLNTYFCDYLTPTCKSKFFSALKTLQQEKTTQEIDATMLCPYKKGRNIHLLLNKPDKPTDDCSTIIVLVDNTRQITEKAQFENTKTYLQRIANNDALTGLPNRKSFRDNLRNAMLSARTSNRNIALLYFDIDKFKSINDQFGHHAGDSLLCEISNRLRTRTRDVGRLARLGGDEFTMTYEYSGSFDSVNKEAQSILDIISIPVSVASKSIQVTSSIGISMYPQHAKTPEELIRQADAAMYQTKAKGGNGVCIFSKDLKYQLQRQRELEHGVDRALKQSEFFCEYQPIVNSCNGTTHSMETLVRWNHPIFGVLKPADFISLAERSGQIGELGLWVLNETCRILKQRSLYSADKFAINLSPIQLSDPHVIDNIQRIVSKHQVSPDSIEFEITESCIIHNMDDCLRVTTALKERGFSLSIDDFGTGYSSFARLIDLPIARLKLDRQLIKNITNRSHAAKVVKGMIRIAHDIGIKVVAEGVETQQQADLLRSYGSDFLQGFYINHAAPLETLEAGTPL